MIKFQRRRLRCWLERIPFDYYNYYDTPPLLEFESEQELVEYLHEALPYIKESTAATLEISENVVIWGTVIGFIRKE